MSVVTSLVMCIMSIASPVNLLWVLMRYSSHTWTEWHFVICCTKLMVWLAILMLYPMTYVSFWCQHLHSWQMLLVDNLIVALPCHGEFHAGWCLNPPPIASFPQALNLTNMWHCVDLWFECPMVWIWFQSSDECSLLHLIATCISHFMWICATVF